ncbi:MAG: FtsX-like permease family protein [Bacteroidetes bacterium]|jgi:predicted permease|nr:FtsX-like permease family protein [Bacteroidota bacterium]
MFKNYFKTALRNLKHRKAYALINIIGLAIGIASCLLIYMVVKYELSYDKFQPDYARIYHVVKANKYAEGINYNPGTPYPAVDGLRQDFPETTVGSIYATYGSQIAIPDEKPNSAPKKFIEEEGLFFADPEFFKVFHFKWLIGNESILKEPNTIALSKTIAEKYYGDWKKAIGKMIRLNNAMDLKVSGILEDVPNNTNFPITLVGSFITIKNNGYYGYNADFGSNTSNYQAFMLIPENVPLTNINTRLEEFSKKNYRKSLTISKGHELQPLSELHFDTRISALGGSVTPYSVLTTLSFIAILIITMACINFINLSTAQAVTRSKEVGVRKVMGSNRLQLFWQMMGETKLLVIISVLLAIILAKIALPYLKHVVSIQEELTLFTLTNFLFLAGIMFLTTLLSGLYPSLILSGFKPVVALKNKVSSASIGGISLRRGLVVTQFAISQILIIGTIVALSQMNFIREADLGFNKEAVLMLSSNTDSAVLARNRAFKNHLLSIKGVQNVSFTSDVPSSDNTWDTNFSFDRKKDEDYNLSLKFGDEDYFKTFGLEFAAGTGYKKSDTITDVVVNETFVKKLNISDPEKVIGKQVRMGGGRWNTITGVVKDFKTKSLREEISPILIGSHKIKSDKIAVKLNSGNLSTTLKEIEKGWNAFYPEYAYSSFFVDESIENFYRQETQLSLMYRVFAIIAIAISCLGLYGLVSFMVAQKTKEVGIRKVLGASAINIVYLFSKEFTLLIGIAFLIAAPIAWYFMHDWLNNFAFHISIGAGVFIIAAVTSVSVAWLSVGYKAFKAAISNPVKSLRTE